MSCKSVQIWLAHGRKAIGGLGLAGNYRYYSLAKHYIPFDSIYCTLPTVYIRSIFTFNTVSGFDNGVIGYCT